MNYLFIINFVLLPLAAYFLIGVISVLICKSLFRRDMHAASLNPCLATPILDDGRLVYCFFCWPIYFLILFWDEVFIRFLWWL